MLTPVLFPDLPLVLQKVEINATVVDLAGEVIVKQTYFNPTVETLQCRYTLPLDENSAVFAFEASFDGVVVMAVAKEKTAAFQEYSRAVSSGHHAALLVRPTMMSQTMMTMKSCNETLVWDTKRSLFVLLGDLSSACDQLPHRTMILSNLYLSLRPQTESHHCVGVRAVNVIAGHPWRATNAGAECVHRRMSHKVFAAEFDIVTIVNHIDSGGVKQQPVPDPGVLYTCLGGHVHDHR